MSACTHCTSALTYTYIIETSNLSLKLVGLPSPHLLSQHILVSFSSLVPKTITLKPYKSDDLFTNLWSFPAAYNQ